MRIHVEPTGDPWYVYRYEVEYEYQGRVHRMTGYADTERKVQREIKRRIRRWKRTVKDAI